MIRCFVCDDETHNEIRSILNFNQTLCDFIFFNLTAVITTVVCYNIAVQTPWKWQSSAKTCSNNLITLLFYIHYMCISWFYEWVQSRCTKWVMLKHTSFIVWFNLYILHDHIILLCSLWVSLVFNHWQSQGVVHITVYFFYCSPKHQSCHRRSQQLQASYAKKTIMLSRTTKERPWTPQCSKIYFFIFEHIHNTFTAAALRVECCILYLLTYGGMLVTSMIY